MYVRLLIDQEITYTAIEKEFANKLKTLNGHVRIMFLGEATSNIQVVSCRAV